MALDCSTRIDGQDIIDECQSIGPFDAEHRFGEILAAVISEAEEYLNTAERNEVRHRYSQNLAMALALELERRGAKKQLVWALVILVAVDPIGREAARQPPQAHSREKWQISTALSASAAFALAAHFFENGSFDLLLSPGERERIKSAADAWFHWGLETQTNVRRSHGSLSKKLKGLSQSFRMYFDEEKQPALPAPAKKAKKGQHPESLRVVEAIGTTGNTDADQGVAAAWGCLTQPLPLSAGLDPATLKTVLEIEFPWFTEAIAAIVQDLRLRKSVGVTWCKWRPLLLVGPSGSGKTRFARRLAELMDLGFGEVNAAGSSDNRLLQGTARGWSSASPTYVLHVMRQAKRANPVIFVDEVDKIATDSRNGDIRHTLLTMLEPTSARAWPDEALVAPADLSAVNWILAANDEANLKGPLLTRLRVVHVPLPDVQHFETVLANIRRDIAGELGVHAEHLPHLSDEAVESIRRGMQRGISLRRLRAAYEATLSIGLEITGDHLRKPN